jgi:tetratricopeptide (TPR) repeat protein
MREVAGLEPELHQVADFMSDWESSQEVENLYLRALRGKEEAWGAKHTSTLDTVNNLGILYADQGKMKEAEEMYLRALRGREEAWGPKHTSTVDTVYSLGNLYRDQGEIVKAKHIYERAAEGYEGVEVDRKAHIAYIRSSFHFSWQRRAKRIVPARPSTVSRSLLLLEHQRRRAWLLLAASLMLVARVVKRPSGTGNGIFSCEH